MSTTTSQRPPSGAASLNGRQLRESYLRFFKERGHTVVKSSSLVPQDDPTLLFTNAGMNQFKEIFLGRRPCPYTPARAASSQKCLRAGGKHNDLENVGFTTRHHTFFEMLGNWSFGDYYKKEAIAWAWEYVTGALKLPEAALYATVFREDDEAFGIWEREIGLPKTRISRLDESDNFWAMGETGPCGPCSEIHYDRGAEVGCGKPECGPGCECGRFVEIWNLVFMEFNRNEQAKLVPLPAKNVDTGMGLERVLAILQGVPSNFDTDLFKPIFDAIERDTGKRRDDAEFMPSFRVVGDHLRALAFSIADGAIPGNEGRGYVLRRILRRAVRHCRKLGVHEPYIWTLLPELDRVMGDDYPEIRERAAMIERVIRSEEESFGRTIDRGLVLFEKVAAEAAEAKDRTIPGESVFLLYDTYGFPADLTGVMARERGLAVDEAGFERSMDAQRERSRAGADFKMAAEGEWSESAGLPGVAGRFVRALYPDDPNDADSKSLREHLEKGNSLHLDGLRVLRWRPAPASVKGNSGEDLFEVVLDRTPFYAQSGGQVGDSGWLEAVVDAGSVAPPERFPNLHLAGKTATIKLRVVDTIGSPNGNAHRVIAEPKELDLIANRPVMAKVDLDRRRAIMRNHTATHLLHAALRKRLGTHVTQAGSLVAPDRLRFDFHHTAKVSREELDQIEKDVSAAVAKDRKVETEVTTYDEARAHGAMALFGEKYGDRVRMVSIPDPDLTSRELCGGTHCAQTAEIEAFAIVAERSVASGIRRVEALTGAEAKKHIQDLTARPAVSESDAKPKEKPREKADAGSAKAAAGKLLAGAAAVSGARVISARVETGSVEELKAIGDALRGEGSGIAAVLAGEWDGKAIFVSVVSDDLVGRGLHAGKMVGAVAALTGGKGGGNPTFAQAGAKDPAKVAEALAAVEGHVRSALGG